MNSLEVMAFNDFQCPKNDLWCCQNRALLSKNRNPYQSENSPLKKSSEWIRCIRKSAERWVVAHVMICIVRCSLYGTIVHDGARDFSQSCTLLLLFSSKFSLSPLSFFTLSYFSLFFGLSSSFLILFNLFWSISLIEFMQ